VIDTGALLQLIWASFVAGLALIAAVSFGILGAARAGHERRRRNSRAASFYTGVAAASIVVCTLGVVAGVAIMLDK
jgi:hypothetical protein